MLPRRAQCQPQTIRLDPIGRGHLAKLDRWMYHPFHSVHKLDWETTKLLKGHCMLGIREVSRGPHRVTFAAIGVVLVLGALLRFHNLGSESLWLDEVVSWTQAKDSLPDLIKRTADDNYPPLNNL